MSDSEKLSDSTQGVGSEVKISQKSARSGGVRVTSPQWSSEFKLWNHPFGGLSPAGDLISGCTCTCFGGWSKTKVGITK